MKTVNVIESAAELVQLAKDDVLPGTTKLLVASDLSSCKLTQSGAYQLDPSITPKDLIAFVSHKAKIEVVFS